MEQTSIRSWVVIEQMDKSDSEKMRLTTTEKLASLQNSPSSIRNICILAHVDHGKTTLADALVASNGIISQRMAGKLRYMDSREDEQIRGITMKSSAISLHFQRASDEFLINLIDSPGHVDFSSEVSTAVRLCDGAIVIVDVVEGVCPQTHAVLRQAWLENIKPILVLNKVDRLIMELKMEPLEAFIHLQQTLEQVNLLTSELFTADVMSLHTVQDENTNSEAQNYDWTEDADEMEHKNIYFSPDLGNVVFASAYDGWGFTVGQFAEIYSKKLGMSEQGLRKTLWGDFYLNSKSKRIMKGAQSKGKKPLFVQFVLETIWSVYDSIMVRRDKEMMEKIVKSLNLTIAPRDSRHNDSRVQLQAVMGQWLPVSQAVLYEVVDKLPSPCAIEEEKIEKLMVNQATRFDSLPEETQALKNAFLSCKSDEEAPVIVFVSKMFPVDKSLLPKNKQRPLTDEEIQKRRQEVRIRHAAKLAGNQSESNTELSANNESNESNNTANGSALPDENKSTRMEEEEDDNVFIAFARVYSGTVRKGQKLFVLGPKHDPAKALEKKLECSNLDSSKTVSDLTADDHITVVTITSLYLFMGRELEDLDSVPAGNVLGIGGLEDHILKFGTVSSSVACPAFTDLYFDAAPILRVALEPSQAGEMAQLVRGLKLLNQADPCVQVLVQETGEHVIVTAGEVHLGRCIDDLEQRYAKVKVCASAPIVPFRETIVPPPTFDMVNESIQEQNQMARNDRSKEIEEDDEVLDVGLVKICTPNGQCWVQIRSQPLPAEVTQYLDDNQSLIKTLDVYVSSKFSEKNRSKVFVGAKLKQSTKESMKEFKEKLDELFEHAGKQWCGYADRIWAFGPKRVGPNLLINNVEDYQRTTIWDTIFSDKKLTGWNIREFDYSVVSGFQLATLVGPLCDEPMRGVCFIVEEWEMGQTTEKVNSDEKGIGQTILNFSEEQKAVDQQSASNSTDCDVENAIPEDTEKLNNQLLNTPLLQDNLKEAVYIENRQNGSAKMTFKRNEGQGHLSGQLISIMKEGCRKAFITQPQRLMIAMYKCNIQATTEVLGKLYGVIGKRNGRIIGEEMREGTQIFNVEAVIPVVESFGFAEDIRKKTSGLASPQLVFSHWEVLDVDPFWVPTTEEEIMHYGEKADSENTARNYMNSVRERKGLKVDKKIVEHAEKQRTLTKNK